MRITNTLDGWHERVIQSVEICEVICQAGEAVFHHQMRELKIRREAKYF